MLPVVVFGQEDEKTKTDVSVVVSVTNREGESVEKSYPATDTEIVRRCTFVEIEGKYYYDVSVLLKTILHLKAKPIIMNELFSPYVYTDDVKGRAVLMIVRDINGKKIYKKTFKNSYLYIFSNGEMHVGQPKFKKVFISRAGEDCYGIVKEKEGVW